MRTKRTKPKKQAKKFTKFLAVFRKDVELQATNLTKDAAKQIAQDARDAIEDQTFNWTPLKPEYLKHKEKTGLDPRIMIATRFYLMSISWGVTGGKVWTGVPSQKIHEPSGLPLHVLARIHEFGTATIPPRPLWRPVLSNFMRKRKAFAAKYRKAAVDTFNKKISEK